MSTLFFNKFIFSDYVTLNMNKSLWGSRIKKIIQALDSHGVFALIKGDMKNYKKKSDFTVVSQVTEVSCVRAIIQSQRTLIFMYSALLSNNGLEKFFYGFSF